MATYEWCSARIRKEENIIDYSDGSSSITFDGDEAVVDFLKKAGENGKVFSNDNWRKLYYNSKTGDIFIPEIYPPEEICEIKKAFLIFISRDDHEDVDYKEVEIED